MGRVRSSQAPVAANLVAERPSTMTLPKSGVKAVYTHTRKMPGTEYGSLSEEPVSSGLSNVDTASFGHDDSMEAYKSQMLDLVYERSLQRLGLD